MNKNDLVVGHCSQLWEEKGIVNLINSYRDMLGVSEVNSIEEYENQLTKNKTETPLFWVNFDYQKYKELGEKGSCTTHIHPILKDDEYIKKTLNSLIDYIRNKYYMEEL